MSGVFRPPASVLCSYIGPWQGQGCRRGAAESRILRRPAGPNPDGIHYLSTFTNNYHPVRPVCKRVKQNAQNTRNRHRVCREQATPSIPDVNAANIHHNHAQILKHLYVTLDGTERLPELPCQPRCSNRFIFGVILRDTKRRQFMDKSLSFS